MTYEKLKAAYEEAMKGTDCPSEIFTPEGIYTKEGFKPWQQPPAKNAGAK